MDTRSPGYCAREIVTNLGTHEEEEEEERESVSAAWVSVSPCSRMFLQTAQWPGWCWWLLNSWSLMCCSRLSSFSLSLHTSCL